VTADEVGDPHDLHIELWVDDKKRQDVNSGEMMTRIPGMIAYASRVMTLNPGDVFTTGSPAGVGEIKDGETMIAQIEKIGRMNVYVKAGPRPRSA
jgi:2-keto-4-pentenoate hydratase/2-oxohepta-3-ene-1,7-dioic acid hydratase in catechol pathway